MRIAIISPLDMRVPPIGYGGTELIVSLLTEELVRRGHDVTLFASGDSITRARLVSVCPRFLRDSGRNGTLLNMLNVVACLERSGEFDIIHNHTALEGMSTAGLIGTPMLTTLHGQIEGDFVDLFQRYRGWYNTISYSAKTRLPPKDRFAGVVHNAIECATYPLNAGRREDFLLFLSRMSLEKGPHIAIAIARRLGKRLIMAGNVDGPDRPFFESQVLPHVDGDMVQYVGEATGDMKRDLLRRARCLLAPVCWPEPFGLFMVEAMACGAPVVAFRRGAVPEVVAHGLSGFVVDTQDEMADAVRLLDEISPLNCRRHVELHFDAPRMVDDYLGVYERVVREGTSQAEERLDLLGAFPSTGAPSLALAAAVSDAAAIRQKGPSPLAQMGDVVTILSGDSST